MLLPEKYESIFDVSSKGPSSGSLVNFPTKGLCSKRRRYFHIFQVEANLTYCEDIYEVSTYTGSCCSLKPVVFRLLPFCFSFMVTYLKFQQYCHRITGLSFSLHNFLSADRQILIGHSQVVNRFSPVDLLFYLNGAE